jgi:membrane associated rhomboid family serine protease
MVVLTNVWHIAGFCIPFLNSCHPDWRTASGLVELLVWSVVSPFVHTSFTHLVGDVAAFVFLGSLVEVWVTRLPVKTRHMILLIGYGATVFVNLLEVFRGGAAAGSSLWSYTLLAVPLYYWFKFHGETKRFWSYPILGGLVLLFIPLGEMVFFGMLRSSVEHFVGLYYGALIPAYMLRNKGFR